MVIAVLLSCWTANTLMGAVALFLPQDIGGSNAFQGQDIMGGAAVIFKRPARVRDLVGGAALVKTYGSK